MKLAAIASAHGLRGQVKLRCFTEHAEDIADYNPLLDESGARQWEVRVTGRWASGVVAALSGVVTREQAEALKGTALYADVEPEPTGDNEYYAGQLMNLAVRDAAGTEIGRVAGVYNFGAGNIVEIAFADGKTEMYPFRDAFFPEVTVAEGWMRFEGAGEM